MIETDDTEIIAAATLDRLFINSMNECVELSPVWFVYRF
jgi:hypothetical protein